MNQLRLAGCIITNSSGEVLLLHRDTPKRTQWEIPGGKIDEGESEQETVVREIAEELGVTVKLARRLGSREFMEDTYTMHYAWYLGEVMEGKPRIAEPHTFNDLRYFGLEAMTGIASQLSGNAQNFLEAWRSGQVQLDHD